MKASFLTRAARCVFLSFLCLFLGAAVFAQKTITGKVIERKSSNPIAGVSIVEKGTQNGATTDDKGAFSITVKSANPVLQISFVGYKAQEQNVSNKSRLDIF